MVPMVLKIAPNKSFTAYNENVLMSFQLIFSPQTIFYFSDDKSIVWSDENKPIIIERLINLSLPTPCRISGELESFQNCHILVAEIRF